ncbi:MAG: tRNA pseudouridine(55) synthase TruB [Desulfuromonadaceae bacterium GWC2_58_13]|nr:MAG: tRNA pseudouridine(55) synthase TruB [Desulfuromonadaceae bacterium GWC2_58_13]
MEGLLVIDKPGGVTSHDVVRQVRRMCRQRQVGHAGTLDPMATGILVVGVGEATRIIQFLMAGEKTYRATLKLGESTDTQDAEGNILVQRGWETITADAVLRVSQLFVGAIRQMPPMFSALKKDGVPLYRLARQGIEVEREAREVTIQQIRVEKIDLPFITLVVDCSKGTYIRTLCHDIGEMLGCGAHLTALRRTRSGCFSEEDSIRLEDYANVPDSLPLLSFEHGLRDYPSYAVSPEAAARLRNGIPPKADEVSGGSLPDAGRTVLLFDSGTLLAASRFAPGRENERRGDFELIRVFPRTSAAR